MPSKRKRGNAYELRASCGFNAKGKRIMKTRTWKPPYGMTEAQAEKEATRQAFLFEEEIRRGEVLDQSTKMEDFLVKWLHNYAEKQLRATTLTGYKSMLPRINAAFGKMKISDIRPTHLLAFYDNLSDVGVRGDEYFTATELVGELAAERFACSPVGRSRGKPQSESARRSGRISTRCLLPTREGLSPRIRYGITTVCCP